MPFPAVLEALMMEATFEILREAGARLPRTIGQTVSIVGALVIGEAAVSAGIISNAMVIVVALTGICSYVAPIYNFAAVSRLLKLLMLLFGAFLGLYGVLLGAVVIIGHLASLRSFGVPYLAPIAPFIVEDMDDVFFRFPIWSNKKRPSYLQSKTPNKTNHAKVPSPPQQKGGAS